MSESTISDSTTADPALVAPAVAAEKVAQGALLIDVRSEGARTKFGTVPGAEVVAKDAVQERFGQVSAADGEIVVFCGSEVGSGPVVAQLVELGYTRVSHVAGGYPEWQAAGLPTTPGVAPE
ncbi:hypothetical protein D1871_21095 [Nakamurella silvestris]|nr:hypothetical protein D1871_21095 [Nakamurella silvestris]